MARRTIAGMSASLMGAFCLSALLLAASASPVADAAMQGDKDTVRSLLKQGVDVNAAQGDGLTALHWAAMSGDVELAQMLLYAGANVKATTRLGGYTPLMLAARQGDAPMVETLLKGGSDAKAGTTTGTTPLMLAAGSGNADAVRILLDNGADVHAKERAMEQTALMFAAAYGRGDAIKVLLERGADIKAATKVTDLAAFSAEEEERRQAQQGQVPGQEQRQGQVQEPAQGLRGGGPRGSGGAVEPPAAEPRATEGQRPAASGAAPAEEAPRQGRGERAPEGSPAGAAAAGNNAPPKKPQVPGVDRQYLFNELVGKQGGMTPLLVAVRQGHMAAVRVLLESGADVNQVSGDTTSPLLMATINGHFDIAQHLLDKGADPNLAAENGVTPLYAALNVQWAPKSLYPQPRAYLQQKLTYLELMTALLAKGADPNVRLKKKVWYSGYNFDLSGVDEIGATPFWRAAYASDVDAMRLLATRGADPNIPTIKPAGRPRTGDGGREATKDVSGKPPIPLGGPSVTPLQAAAGVGYGEGFAANSHRNHPGGWMPAVKYLVEELGADVNAEDHEGNTALHHAAARGDNELILYLVSKGADVKAVTREGQTTADMANGPVQRTQPFPETVALLMKLGSKNSNKCVSC